jgi:hypothetical protein
MLDKLVDLPEWTELKVKWKDAHSPDSGWHNPETYEPKESTATTLGRYWKNCQEGYLTIVGTIFESELPNPECVGDINHVPLGWITSIEILGEQHGI